MTMPHKICPQCGQPAVLTMTQCRRCGFVYAPAPPFRLPHASAGPNAVEMPHTSPPRRKSSAGPLLFVALLGCGVLLLGTLARVLTHTAIPRSTFHGRGLPGGTGVNAAPADAAASSGKLSFFTESESQQETPVLTFRNWESFTLTLTLRDRYGHVYRASSQGEGVATLQFPAGDYSVSIDCDDPRVRPNWGDATFRKFKSYHADFAAVHGDRRIHLGD